MFTVGQTLYWNPEVVPFNKQPRPNIGTVVRHWDGGVVLAVKRLHGDSYEIFYTWSELARFAQQG